MNLTVVMLGGAIGAALRYLLYINFKNPIFFIQNPGILIANALGALLLGFLNHSPYANQNLLHTFLSIGFLGALTTFSTFIAEIFTIANKHQLYTCILYLIIHIGIGLFFYYFGLSIGNQIYHG